MWKKKPKNLRKKSFAGRIFFPVLIVLAWVVLVVLLYQLLTRVFITKQQVISPMPASLSRNQVLQGDTSTFLTTRIVESLLQKHAIVFESVYFLENDTYVVLLPNDQEVILSAGKSLDEQISSLQLITSRLTIEGKRFSRLDFRFNKPVITLYE